MVYSSSVVGPVKSRRLKGLRVIFSGIFDASLSGLLDFSLFTSGFECVFGVLHIIEVLFVVTVRVTVLILAVFY